MIFFRRTTAGPLDQPEPYINQAEVQEGSDRQRDGKSKKKQITYMGLKGRKTLQSSKHFIIRRTKSAFPTAQIRRATAENLLIGFLNMREYQSIATFV